MKNKNLWTYEELILAFNLYWQIPFGKMHTSNSKIIYLANLIGRTPSSITLRLVNFASVDPYHRNRGVKGMDGGTKVVQPIWDEFNQDREKLISLSEEILASRENTTLESKYNDILSDLKDIKGVDKDRLVKTRINQSYFRRMILSNYVDKCAITGIDIPELLFASHIIPWSQNEKERLNPENGICLSALYDKAFDKGLIGINNNNKIILSSNLKTYATKEYYQQHFKSIEGRTLTAPTKYHPKQEFLEFHLDTIFDKC